MEPSQSLFRSGTKEVPALQGSQRVTSGHSDTENQLYPVVENASQSAGEHLTLDDDQDVSFDTPLINSQTSSSFSSQSPEDMQEVVRSSAPQPEKEPRQSPLLQPEGPPEEHSRKETASLPLQIVSASEITAQSRRNSSLNIENRHFVYGSSSQDYPRRSSERQSLVSDSLYPLKNGNTNPTNRSPVGFLRSHEEEVPSQGRGAGYSNDSANVIRTDTTPRSILRQPGSSRPRKNFHRISFASMRDEVVEDRDDYDEESDYDISEPSIGHSVLKTIQIYGRSSISFANSHPVINNRDSLQQRPQDTFRSQSREYQLMEQHNVSNNRNDVNDDTVDAQPRVAMLAATPQEPLGEGPSRTQPHSHRFAEGDPPPEVVMTDTQRRTIIPEEDSYTEESSTSEASQMDKHQGEISSQSHSPHVQASPESQHLSNSLKSPSQRETTLVHEKSIDSALEESFYSEGSSTSSNTPILVSIPNSHHDALLEKRGNSQEAASLNHRDHFQHSQKGVGKDTSSVHSESDSMGRDSMPNMDRSHLTDTTITKKVGERTDSNRIESKISSKHKESTPVKVLQDYRSESFSTLQPAYENPGEANALCENGTASSTSEVPRVISSTHRPQSPPKSLDVLRSKGKREIHPSSVSLKPEQSVPTYSYPREHSNHSAKGHSADDSLRSDSATPGMPSSDPSGSRPAAAHRNSSEIKRTKSPLTHQVNNNNSYGALIHPKEEKMNSTDEFSRKFIPDYGSFSPDPVSKIGVSHEVRKGEAAAVKPLIPVNSSPQRENTTKQNAAVTPRKDSKGGNPDTSLYHDAAAQPSPNPEPYDTPLQSKKVTRKNLILVTRRKRKNGDASDGNSIVKMSIIPIRQVGADQESDRAGALKKLFNSFMTRSTSKSSSDHSHHRITGKTKHKKKKRRSQDDIKDVSQRENHSKPKLLGTSLESFSNHSSASPARTSGTGPSEHEVIKFCSDARAKELDPVHSVQGRFLDEEKPDSIRVSEKSHTRRKTNSSLATGSSPAHIEPDVSPARNEILIEDDFISIMQEESTSTQHEGPILTLQNDSDITEMDQKQRKRAMTADLPKSSTNGAHYDAQEPSGIGSNTLRNPHVSAQESHKTSKQIQVQLEKPFQSSEDANISYALQTPKEGSGRIYNRNTSEHAVMPIWIAKPAIHLVHLPTGEVSATDEPMPLLFSRSHVDSDETEKGTLSITRGNLGDMASQNPFQFVLSNGTFLSSKHEKKKMYNKEVLTESSATFDSVQNVDKQSCQTLKKPQSHAHGHSNLGAFSIHQSNGEKTQGTQHHNSNRCRSVQNEIDDDKGGRQGGEGNTNHSARPPSLESSPSDRGREKQCDKSCRNVDNRSGSDPTPLLGKERSFEQEDRLSRTSPRRSMNRDVNLSQDSDASQVQATSGSSLIRQSDVPEAEPPLGVVQASSKSGSDHRHRHHHHHHRHRHHSHHTHREDEISKGKWRKKSKSRSPNQHRPLDHKSSQERIEDLFKEDLATSLEYQLGVLMEKKHNKEKRRLKKEHKKHREMEKGMTRDFSVSEVEVGTRIFEVLPSTSYQTKNDTHKLVSYMRPRFATPKVIAEDEHRNRANQPHVRQKRTQSLPSQPTKMLNDVHQNWPDTARHSLDDTRHDPVASFSRRSTSWDDYKRAASCTEKFSDGYSRPPESNSDLSGRRQGLGFPYDPLRSLEGTYVRNNSKDVKDVLKDSFSPSNSYFNRSTSRDRNQLVSPFVQVGKSSFGSSYHKDAAENNSSFVHELVDTPPRRGRASFITPRNVHHGGNKSVLERGSRVERYLPSPVVQEASGYETDGRPLITEYVVKDRRAAREFVYAMRRVVDGLNLYKVLV
ncbi:unnamed protein product [Phytomonas sp. EM1]|nr:unnamed protein product [Phytomonas sp. EM1]|eukprot:CCW60567.1 unnamed protein product [Phytomonas sp. isolate EM1]